MDYYDAVLAMVPVSMIGLSGGSYLSGLPVEMGIIAGSLISIFVIFHAMFVNTPTIP